MTTRVILGLLTLVVATSPAVLASGSSGTAGEKTLRFPKPPHPRAIGTSVGSIDTYIREVTMSRPRLVHRYGLVYFEVRGVIDGIGWGGEAASEDLLQQHYAYRLPYVLRVPPLWDGTLVVHRHGTSPLGFWEFLEASLGERNLGRRFHESADRFVSDVALHPARRWAFFAVNQTPIDPGGAHNTRLLAGPDDTTGAGDPVHSMLDIPIARDTTRLAQYLLEKVARRAPRLTFGTGHSGGALTNFMLNAGIDHLRTGSPPVMAGDNHVRPYKPASGRIYDGFVSFGRGSEPPVPVDPERGLSAPTMFVEGELDIGALAMMAQVDDLIARGVDVSSLARIYMVRGMPHIDADLVAAITTTGREFAGLLGLPEDFYFGRGDRLRPLTGVLFDSLRKWAKYGLPPQDSAFNGIAEDTDDVPGVDSVRFVNSIGGDVWSFPYLDNPRFDAIWAPPVVPTDNDVALAERWARVREALNARTEPIGLPEAACRRAFFTYIAAGPVGAWLTPYDEKRFQFEWGSQAGHQSCRVGVVDSLVGQDLYDPLVATIDIEERIYPNAVKLSGKGGGRLRVVIFSTAGFDAQQIFPATLRLAGASAAGKTTGPRPTLTRAADFNGDGRLDLLAEFPDDVELTADDRVAEVWGWTRKGPFTGSDHIDVAAPFTTAASTAAPGR